MLIGPFKLVICVDFFKRMCYNVIVVFANKEVRDVEKTKLIDFSEARDSLFDAAYKWAVSEQIRLGFVAQPVVYLFERDELTYDQKLVYVSVFHDRNTGETLLRRDWDNLRVTQYNVLANYAECLKVAPRSMEKLKQNGVELYKRYSRAGFGI